MEGFMSKEPRPSRRGFCKPRGNLPPLRYGLPFIPRPTGRGILAGFGKTCQSMAALVLVLGALMGCDVESRAAGWANPARVAELQQTLRELWLGHIYWVQHAV